ncbi:stealth family protein [Kitasatospora sp. NPDC088548]|uniref:stealth family protein n=1 Tax=Kitasatospora sp. NPDC088548 TaxID=3364075 RepID=UPI0038267A57
MPSTHVAAILRKRLLGIVGAKAPQPPAPVPAQPAPPAAPVAPAEPAPDPLAEREAQLAEELSTVVRHGDRLAYPGGDYWPAQAWDENLEEAAAALRAAGLAFALVPDPEFRHRLAIRPGDRAAVLDACATAFAGQAVYADLLEHGRTLRTVLAEQLPVAVAQFEAPADELPTERGAQDERDAEDPAEQEQEQEQEQVRDRVKGIRLYRPRLTQGPQYYGADYGCDLEFWDSAEPGPGAIASIAETSFGWWLPSLEATADLRIRGRNYPVLDALAATFPDDVGFPVDVVITWVDDSDPEWQQRRTATRARVLAGLAGHAPDRDGTELPGDADHRYHNRDELRYCLRSIAAHAPWVRHVFLVTDDQTPAWLDSSQPGLTVVSHRELFAGTDALPVFNSHAIETRLHLIPGLAEHFLYINDDVFLGRPVRPQAFFLGNGLSKIFRDTRVIPPDVNDPDAAVHDEENPDDAVYVAAQKNTRAVLERECGRTYPLVLAHVPQPLRRSVMDEASERFADGLAATTRSAFRSATDLAPVTLVTNFAHASGRAVDGHLYHGYFAADSAEDLERLDDLTRERWADVFCLADGARHAVGPQEQDRAVRDFLQEYFPVPSRFEHHGADRPAAQRDGAFTA